MPDEVDCPTFDEPLVHAIGDAYYSFGEPHLTCSCGYDATGDDWAGAGWLMDSHLDDARQRGEIT